MHEACHARHYQATILLESVGCISEGIEYMQCSVWKTPAGDVGLRCS